MEAERLRMFEYMRGVYAAIGQPLPLMPVPPPQPAPNTVSGTVSHFTTLSSPFLVYAESILQRCPDTRN